MSTRRLLSLAAALAGSLFALHLGACTPSQRPGFLGIGPASDPEIFQEKNIGGFEMNGTYRLALTFDDGPSPETKALLGFLREEGIRATFFIQGSNIKGREGAMRLTAADGHLIANHSYSHDSLAKEQYLFDPESLFKEVLGNHALLKPFLQPGQTLFFRAPYGAWKADHAHQLNQDATGRRYIGPVFWTAGGETRFDESGRIVQAADWSCWSQGVSAAECARGYLQEIERRKGGVVLMHDKELTREQRSNGQGTVAMLEILIPQLRSRGYEFVRLDEVRSLDKFQ